MTPKHITFTGVDERTDIEAMKALSADSPSQRSLVMTSEDRLHQRRMRTGGKLGPKAKRWYDKNYTVRIWSDEHRAWWRESAAGYTTVKESAGIYTFQDAFARTRHCGPEKRIIYERLG